MDIDVMAWIRDHLKPELVSPADALAGRQSPMFKTFPKHEIFARLLDEVPDGCQVAYFAMGCYWGAERLFWQLPGVVNSAVGFAGGYTPNPTYREVCTELTGHAETVRIVFNPDQLNYDELLRVFWEHHDPTSPNRQGNDLGTRYRSALFPTSEQQAERAKATRDSFQDALTAAGFGQITTQLEPAAVFYYAERDHQQYLHKHPEGYDCHARTGVSCPLP